MSREGGRTETLYLSGVGYARTRAHEVTSVNTRGKADDGPKEIPLCRPAFPY